MSNQTETTTTETDAQRLRRLAGYREQDAQSAEQSVISSHEAGDDFQTNSQAEREAEEAREIAEEAREEAEHAEAMEARSNAAA